MKFELDIMKNKMDMLQDISYINVNVLVEGKIINTSMVPYSQIIQQISAIREKLKEQGYIYIDKKLKKIN